MLRIEQCRRRPRRCAGRGMLRSGIACRCGRWRNDGLDRREFHCRRLHRLLPLTPPESARADAPRIGSFERNLTWWVFACILAGILLAQLLPGLSSAVGALKLAEVNVPVAVLVWLMVIPMLLKIDFARLAEVKQHARGIG